MYVVRELLPLIISILILIAIIISVIKKVKSPIYIVLLGIETSIIGGILVLDTRYYIGLIEYLLVISGLIITIVGITKEVKKNLE